MNRAKWRRMVFIVALVWAAVVYGNLVWLMRLGERQAADRAEAIAVQQRQVITATYDAPVKTDEDKPPYLGEYTISFYTAAANENGGYEGLTVTGGPIVPGETAAVAHGALPLGTVVYIDGVGYRTISDYGCREGYIDVAVETKEEAFELGVYEAGVWLCMEAGA